MAGLNEPLTNEKIAAQIGEIARSTNSDSFRVRISRKDNAQQFVPKIIANLDGATSDHLSSPETWLGQLAGGGHYYLQAVHKTNPTAPFAPIQVVMSGDPLPPDPYADTRPTWRGPETIIMPEKTPKPPEELGGPTYVGSLGAMGSSPRNGALQGSAPSGPAPIAPPADNAAAYERMRVQQMQDDLGRRERAAAESQHLKEMELIRKQNELDLAKIRAEMATAAAQKPQGEDPLVKMLAVMREESRAREALEESRRREDREREDRKLEAERIREERRMEREREDRKERAEAQMRIEERLANERKAADDRMMTMLSDKQHATKEMMEMISPLTEVMGQTMNMVVQSMHAIQELQPAETGDPPMLKLVGKIVDGIQAAAVAARVPPVQIRQPVQQQRPAATRTLSAVPPSRPETAPPPRPAPAPAPTGQVASPMRPVTPAFDGVEPKSTVPALERLLEMIKKKVNPAKVARFFYANVNEPSIATELSKNNMSVVTTFAPFLLPWLKNSEANQAYLREVFAAVQQLGTEMGAIEASAESEEENEEEENEEEAEEGDGLDDAIDNGADGDGVSTNGGEAALE
jgi:hypothetical protein